MTYIDLHCHLDLPEFDSNREEILSKMKEAKVFALVNTLNPKGYEKACKIFEKHKDTVSICPGLYPQEAEKISEKEFEEYLKLLKKTKDNFLAIGEIGLDAHHTKEEKLLEIQEKRFRKLIELGIEINKPLIIHTRRQEEKVINIIKEYVEKTGFRKFNLHCFTGKKRLIKEIKELKIYCSIPTIVENTESFRLLVSEISPRNLFAETDSPYLHPEKIQNTPLSVISTYKEIAKIKGLNEEEIENIIYRNYQRLIN